MSDASHTVRFPGESAEYRASRNALLDAETALRAQVEAVASLRRRLPLGGTVPDDYECQEGAVGPDNVDAATPVRLSSLFAPGQDTLIVYSFMYGPAMERPCPSGTSILDALDGSTQHVTQRASVAVVAKSPLRRIRGWRTRRSTRSA